MKKKLQFYKLLEQRNEGQKTQGIPHPLKHELTKNCQIDERNNFGHKKKLEKLQRPKKE
jgi:hypothetical protein